MLTIFKNMGKLLVVADTIDSRRQSTYGRHLQPVNLFDCLFAVPNQ